MIWLIVDAENYFYKERDDYSIKKGSKGIKENVDSINIGDFLLIYNVSKQIIEEIYVVVKDVTPTDNENYPLCIEISYIHKLVDPITFEEMKQLIPQSQYVSDQRRRAIGKITPNQWKVLRNRLLENYRLSELVRLFND